MRCGVSYTPISVTITDANINTIVGDGSVIMDLINKLELRLVTDGKVPSAPVSALTLAATQWATSGLLGSYIDDALNVTQSPLILPLGVQNMADLGMEWVESPEYPDNTTFTPT